ncbi:MAG: hypothetical protein JNJ59_13975 [Deltaproteobacteria bacterium]|nr:hypothetical protein [Deltaproteobacteria bacterium]
MLAMFADRPADEFAGGVVREPSALIAAIIEAGRKLSKSKRGKPRTLLDMLPRVMTRAVCEEGPLLYSLANRLVLPHSGGAVDADRAQSLVADEFARHGVAWPLGAVATGGWVMLLQYRAELLERLTADFVARLARWEESDRGPLDDDAELEP